MDNSCPIKKFRRPRPMLIPEVVDFVYFGNIMVNLEELKPHKFVMNLQIKFDNFYSYSHYSCFFNILSQNFMKNCTSYRAATITFLFVKYNYRRSTVKLYGLPIINGDFQECLKKMMFIYALHN
ncbi:hypothetical protein BpHYR1_051252 [Brachionus plicatilis]|uniref:Uncharacterized protein n=1 Tax=Brachionus plicatilis TaxID=10195 RepID=A0A3M7T8V3_BRAPC|nr:hypothetical protein BpHYR1_051252 [Brachionus plicatilis]